jgi:hypothetical protein
MKMGCNEDAYDEYETMNKWLVAHDNIKGNEVREILECKR